MTDLEQRASELFSAAKAWNPVDRRMLDRVADRLESKPRRMPFVAIAAALAALALLFSSTPSTTTTLAEAPVASPGPKFETKRLIRPLKIAAPKPRSRALRPLVVEQPLPRGPIISLVVEEKVSPPPKRYVPRAIADFQAQEDDELRAYIQWIISTPDAMVCR